MVEKTIQENRDARLLRDYVVPTISGTRSSIARYAVQANNFGIIQMIQMSVQFFGMPNDDQNVHIANFLEIYDIFQ